ncbi:MAG: hypothetical protein ABSG46_01170 [Candidatus Binataceae bacterium]|jgi:hypothetical protein
MEAPVDRPPHRAPDESPFPWRGAIFAAATLILIAAALIFYNTGREIPGLAALGFGFSTPMIWVILAAREAEDNDSNIRRFLPRMMVWLVVGAAFLGMFWWNINRMVSLMEAGFGAFYVCAGITAMRIFDAKRRRPNLQAVAGRAINRASRAPTDE